MRLVVVRYGFWVGLLACLMATGPRGSAQEQSVPISPEAQEQIKQLDAKDAYVRQKAFLELEALREPATAAIVRRYLDNKDPETRALSVRALAAVEGAAAIPTLVDRMKNDRHPSVRLAAVLALEPLKDPSVTPAFIERLRDRSPQVRMAAVDVVSRLDDPPARAAIRLRRRREHNRDVQRVLQEAMERVGKP